MPYMVIDKAPHRRGYEAAKGGRLGNWGMFSQSADSEIRQALRAVRSKSRWLAANNDYVRQFFRLCKINVIGAKGIGLQVKAHTDKGQLDQAANAKIEAAWTEWSKRGSCDVTGRLSWLAAQHLFIETVAKDGECLVQLVPGFPNRFGFAIRFLEADHLDENLNVELPNGNTIRMGVEFDQWDRPVAYWLLKRHPGDDLYGGVTVGGLHERIPAEHIIHEYLTERPRQSRGMPWLHTAVRRAGMLDGYEEAALANARAGAAKMGFFIENADGSDVGDYSGPEDSNGDVITEMEPAVLEKLPRGWDFKEFNPGYPNGETEPFCKFMLRGLASGVGVSYHSLTGDLTDVNFSSIRQGELDERDFWRFLQGFVTGGLCARVFEAFLRSALLNRSVELPMSKLARFNAPVWHPRTWAWVDPVKDITATLMEVRSGLKTYTDALAEQGRDFEETLEQIAEERKMAAAKGIDLEIMLGIGAAAKNTNQGSKNNDDEQD